MFNKVPMKTRVALGMLLIFVAGVMSIFFALDYTVKSYIIYQSKNFLAEFIQAQVKTHLKADDFLFSDSSSAKEAFARYIQEVKLPETIQVSIWNRDGLVLFSSNSGLAGRRFPDNPEFLEAISGKAGVRIGPPIREENPVVGIDENGESIEIYVPAIFSGSADPIGAVELYYNFSKVAALITQMKMVLSGIVAILMFAVLGLLWGLFNNQIAKPILALSKALKSFSENQRSVRVGIPAISEIGLLAKSFNEMAASLEELYNNLEIEVEERTKSLDEAMKDLGQEKTAFQNQLILISSLMDNLPIGVFVADAPSGNPRFVNRAAMSLLGIVLRPDIGKDEFAQAYHLYKADGSPYPNKELPLYKTLQTGEGGIKDDVIVKRPNGEIAYIRVISAPVFDVKGKLLHAVAVFYDFTKEKEADRVKTEFVSLASHQLRTPLSAMKWTIELLLEKRGTSKKERERMENLAVSTERLIALVNDLLNVSRIESGKTSGVKIKTDLVQLTSSAVGILNESARKKKQELLFETSLKEAPAEIIPAMYTQAIQNLTANAINYSPEKAKIDMVLSVKNDCYLIEIHNTGGYISQEDSDHLFEKFYRGVDSQRIKAEGSGLGLYITKASVEANGGRIWFESSKEKGTTFYFTIPKPE